MSTPKTDEAEPLNIGVGMPAWLYLNLYAKLIFDAFGRWPYLVGSATRGKQWRDVDVRLILPDDEYDALFGERELDPHFLNWEARNPKWRAYTMAFAELGKQITGLPIDFQIQRQEQANVEYPSARQYRCPLRMLVEVHPTPASPDTPTA